MQIKNIVAKQKYVNKSGEEKIRWINCGSLFIKDDGKMSIKFNAYINPCAFKDEKGDVWLNVFDNDKDKAEAPTQAGAKIEGNNPPQESEDVPF